MVDTIQGREVGLQRIHLNAHGTKRACGLFNFGLIGDNDQIETIFGAALRELIADSGRRASDNSSSSRSGCQRFSPSSLTSKQVNRV
jgi:hypothetical protein